MDDDDARALSRIIFGTLHANAETDRANSTTDACINNIPFTLFACDTDEKKKQH